MNSRIVSFNELSLSDKNTWRSFLDAQCFPNPLNDPDYFSFLRKAGKKIDVIIGYEGDEPVLFVPFQRKTETGIEPVGTEISDCSQFIVKPNYSFEPKELLRTSGLSFYAFDHLFEQHGFDPEKYSYYCDDCFLIRLNKGYDAYVENLNSKSSNLVSQANRKRRKLDREIGSVRFEYQEPDTNLLATLLKWKAEQLDRQGFHHCFHDQWVRTFMESQLSMKSKNTKGLFSVLYAGREIAAMHFGTVGYQVINSWIPVVNPNLTKYSPALTLYLDLAKKAFENDVHTIVLGRGENQTKRRLANDSVPNFVGMIPNGMLRTGTFFGMRCLYRFFRSKWGKGIHSSLRNLRKKLSRK